MWTAVEGFALALDGRGTRVGYVNSVRGHSVTSCMAIYSPCLMIILISYHPCNTKWIQIDIHLRADNLNDVAAPV